jgi:hypothetical protein
MDKKFLYPVVKFRSAVTHPDKSQAIPAIVVKMQDFLRENGEPKTSAIQKVQHAGNLHEYFGATGRIILSPIMPDHLLLNISYDTYAYLVEALQPDQIITPDGITYSGFTKFSRNQIDLVLGITEKLLDRFPECTPIGLVKGCNIPQMDFHLDKLLELGITQVCLHAGDFLYKESNYSKDQVIDFARYIREKVPFLMIYGVGSKHYFQRFHFANCYVTNSHFMQAFNHKVVHGATWVNFKGKPSKEIVMKNFEYLRRQVEHQNDVRDLSEWMTITSPVKPNEPIADHASRDARIMKILEG